MLAIWHLYLKIPHQEEESSEPANEDEALQGDAEGQEASGEEQSVTEHSREAELLAQLSTEEIQTILDSVFTEMLGGIKVGRID